MMTRRLQTHPRTVLRGHSVANLCNFKSPNLMFQRSVIFGTESFRTWSRENPGRSQRVKLISWYWFNWFFSQILEAVRSCQICQDVFRVRTCRSPSCILCVPRPGTCRWKTRSFAKMLGSIDPLTLGSCNMHLCIDRWFDDGHPKVEVYLSLWFSPWQLFAGQQLSSSELPQPFPWIIAGLRGKISVEDAETFTDLLTPTCHEARIMCSFAYSFA